MTDFFSMPMSAGPRDVPVGVDELGNPVYMTTLGSRYVERQKPGFDGSYVKAAANAVRKDPFGAIGNAISGAAQGAWAAFSAPGRAASGEDVTMGDVADVAGMVSLPALAGKYDPAVANMGIRAYHGSPHDFDRFSMDKIGTGEGAQAYGHGLYFAEAEDVARQYRDDLSGGNVSAAKRSLTRAGGDIDAAIQRRRDNIERLQNMPDAGGDPERQAAQIQINRDAIEQLTAFKETGDWTGGHMYEVDINADPADFLDWDAPLSEQSPRVRDTLHRLGRDPEAALDRVTDDMRGGDFARDYPNAIMNANRQVGLVAERMAADEATRRLREAGIPGIKYRDAGSRGIDGAEGVSRNYVVFDDSLIDIIRKYGIAGALPLGALGLEQETRAYLDRLPEG